MKENRLLLFFVAVLLTLGAGYLYKNRIESLTARSSATEPLASISVPSSWGTLSTTLYPPTIGARSDQPGDYQNTFIWISGRNGQYLGGSDGKTLYAYDKDAKGISNCNTACTTPWPPYRTMVTTISFPGISIIKRSDGSTQFAYKGKPLYYYQGDTGPKDTKGDGVDGLWHLVSP